MKPYSAIGLMSGTSADGITAAWIDVECEGRRSKETVRRAKGGTRNSGLRVRSAITAAFPKEEQERILALKEASTRELCEANMELGELFARVANRLIRRVGRRPDVIGSHGQTVYHISGKSTLQIAEPSVIAERTGVTTVADFRPRDIAAGGQGAPLVPYFDEFVFGGRHVRALQNIGGIANVTVVGRGVKTRAFDTGPGNALIDEAVRLTTRGRMSMDRDGKIAAWGRVDTPLLRKLLTHPYLKLRPPKSTGREVFSRELLESVLLGRRSEDVIATLTAFTARSIAEAYRRFLPPVEEVVVSGGGVFNPSLMKFLETFLFPIPVRSIRMYGIDPMAKEAAAFALLGLQCVRGIPNRVGGGAVLGTIVPGRNYSSLMKRVMTAL